MVRVLFASPFRPSATSLWTSRVKTPERFAPVPRTVTYNGGNVTESITYKDTGVLLRVVPRINAGGVVTLDIVQEVTDVGGIDAATGQRSFLQRSLQSRIAIPSGQTAVLGGLIKDNSSNSRNGLPILSGIPGLGALFGATEKSLDRTELLIVLTPRVLDNAQALIDISDEIRARVAPAASGASNGANVAK